MPPAELVHQIEAASAFENPAVHAATMIARTMKARRLRSPEGGVIFGWMVNMMRPEQARAHQQRSFLETPTKALEIPASKRNRTARTNSNLWKRSLATISRDGSRSWRVEEINPQNWPGDYEIFSQQ